MVAMEAELVHLRNLAKSVEQVSINRWTAYELEFNGRSVLAVLAGIGMLNAAAALERVVGERRPDAVLNYGCAGAHHREVNQGDVVIGERTVNQTSLNILSDGSEAHNGRGYLVSGEGIYPAVFDADPGLLAIAQKVAIKHTIEPWNGDSPQPIVRLGPVVSSDIWTQNLARLDVLHERHGSLAEDMEAAAFAHVAALHEIPFLTIKDISNNEYHKPSDLNEFSDFPTAEVGKRAAAYIAEIIRAL